MRPFPTRRELRPEIMGPDLANTGVSVSNSADIADQEPLPPTGWGPSSSASSALVAPILAENRPLVAQFGMQSQTALVPDFRPIPGDLARCCSNLSVGAGSKRRRQRWPHGYPHGWEASAALEHRPVGWSWR